MPYAPDADLVALAFAAGRLIDAGRPVRFGVVDAGRLVVSTGRVVATDPLTGPERRPFTQSFPRGEFPVDLAVAHLDDHDARVAFARVRFDEAPVVRWTLAVAEGEDPAPLGPDEYLGYGVDAGLGCFLDAAASPALVARLGQDGAFAAAIIEGIGPPATGPFTAARPAPGREENVVCFLSGWGDGVYPSAVGWSAGGEPSALLSDFLVVSGVPASPQPRSPRTSARRGPGQRPPWWRRLLGF